MPACGGSIGVERILAIQTASEGGQSTELDVALTVLGAEDDIMRLAGELRCHGLRVGMYLGSSAKLAKQLRWANDQRARSVVIYGPEEQAREVTVRNMETGDQVRVPLAEAVTHLRAQ